MARFEAFIDAQRRPLTGEARGRAQGFAGRAVIEERKTFG
jgi:hypothetical protein